MNIDDYLKSIENGSNFEFNFDPGLMQFISLSIEIRNKLLLEHITSELYPKAQERKKVFAQLNEAAEKEAMALFSQLHLATERRKEK